MFFILGLIIGIAGVCLAFWLYVEYDYATAGTAIGISSVFIAVILILVQFFGTESGSRTLKNISSDIGGLERTMEVYDMTGNLIKTYEGKFDINNNEQGVIKFDINGKRHLIYNAIVIVDEK